MRIIKFFSIVFCAIFFTCDASAQSSQAAQTTPSAMQMSKAEMRAQNRHMAAAVQRAIDRTKGLSASDIRIRVRAGAVSLSGTVPDVAQIAMAGSAAAATSGVKSVDNRVTVRIPGGR
jgi:hyperosmotically inducible periplasmic protein